MQQKHCGRAKQLCQMVRPIICTSKALLPRDCTQRTATYLQMLMQVPFWVTHTWPYLVWMWEDLCAKDQAQLLCLPRLAGADCGFISHCRTC